MAISKKQQNFLDYCKKEKGKPVDVNSRAEVVKVVVCSLFEMYIISDGRNFSKEIAWQLYSLKDEIKENISLWYLIEDVELFARLVREKLKEENKTKISHQKRRHQKREDFSLTVEQWEEVKKHFGNECAYCGSDSKLTYDHFHPFSKGGDFAKGNVIPCCTPCNSSKNNKEFIYWYPKQNFHSLDRMNKVFNYVKENKQLALF